MKRKHQIETETCFKKYIQRNKTQLENTFVRYNEWYSLLDEFIPIIYELPVCIGFNSPGYAEYSKLTHVNFYIRENNYNIHISFGFRNIKKVEYFLYLQPFSFTTGKKYYAYFDTRNFEIFKEILTNILLHKKYMDDSYINSTFRIN